MQNRPGNATETLADERAKRWLFVCLVLALGYLLTQLFSFDYRSRLPDSTLAVKSLFYSEDDTELGELIELPSVWREGGHGELSRNREGWYTAKIALNVPPNRLWAIYFPSIASHSTVFLNGELLGRETQFDEGFGQMHQRPLLLAIPSGMLHSGDNTLRIKVGISSNYFFGTIEPFFLGSEQTLKDAYSTQYFYEISLIKFIGFLLFFTAIGGGLIWALRHEESLYGWFSLACLLWAAHIFSHFSVNNSEQLNYLGYLFRYMSITLFTAVLVVIANRYRQRRSRRVEWVLLAMAGLICLSLPLLPADYLFLASNYVVGLYALSMISYAFAVLLIDQAQRSSPSDLAVALSVTVIFFLSINDLISTLSLTERKYSGMTVHYAAPLFVLVLGWKLIQDYVKARRDAEDLNRSLERRIFEKTRELESNFKTIQQMERREILTRERDRLIMDMHDGLGGQLVSAVSMLNYETIDRQAVSDTLKDALHELRMMIDAVDPASERLEYALGNYRESLERLLKGTGMTLRWEVQDVPACRELSPHELLQILRILQEAISNAIKYSQATELTVSTHARGDKTLMCVRDNGVGFGESPGQGRGLGNMRRRAENIEAEIAFDSDASGATVTLSI